MGFGKFAKKYYKNKFRIFFAESSIVLKRTLLKISLELRQFEISETNLLKQEQALADGQARLFAAHVGLIQALGGGYSQVDVKNK